MELLVDIRRVDDRIEGAISLAASDVSRPFSGWLELCQQLETALESDRASDGRDERSSAAEDGEHTS